MNNIDVKSPCISVCALNEEDLCIGCFRSAGEITCWGRYSPEEKRAVLKRANVRRTAGQTIQLK